MWVEFIVLERVRKSIIRYNMLPPRSAVAVAVSGGADSVCLLHVLAELAPAFEVSLSVAHLNHQLRGAESEEDEKFVGEMAARLGLPYYHARVNVAAARDNLEQAGRRARRAFFDGLGADLIALGHTRDDQAETVLFRVLRGCGLRGLAGIYPIAAGGYIRPLIEATRAEVEEYLGARRIPWRFDASNRDPRFARNRIRYSLLPHLSRDWNPQIGESMAHLAALAQDEESWWETYIDEVSSGMLVKRAQGIELSAPALANLPAAVARRLIRRGIEQVKGNTRRLEFGHIERILELASQTEGDGRLRLPGIEVQRSFDWIRMAAPVSRIKGWPEQFAIRLMIPGVYPAGDGACVHFDVLEDGAASQPEGSNDATLKAAELSLRRLPPVLELRGWKPGDHYRPVGQPRDQKIRDMFQAERVPSWLRPSWPIVSSGDTIFWTRGFGAAAEFAACPEPEPMLRVWEVQPPNS
jgi:tRNA(Ile)-lysidine synthase